MKKILSMLALIIVIGLATTACGNEEEIDSLIIDSNVLDVDASTGGDGNEGGSGGTNSPFSK